jgi:MoaA/NifB/PqqE/SkfB family radical SAM enzyme
LNLYNYKKIDEIIKLANKLGVVSLNIEPICINNPTCEKIKLGVKEREEFLRSVRNYQNLAKKYNVRTNLERLTKLKYLERSGNLLDLILKTARKNDFLNLPCYEPWLWPKIEANGEVWPCSSISLHENIKHKSFKEIWFGKEFQLFRRKIMKNDLPPNCSNCVMTHLATTMEIRDELSKEFKTSNM